MKLFLMYSVIFCLLLWSLAIASYAADVTLAWDSVPNDSRVAGYEVHYGTTPGVYDSMVIADGVAAATAEVKDLDNGSAYYFAVRAKNADGTMFSAFSNEVSIDQRTNLTQPDGLQVISVSAQARVDLVIGGVNTQ